MVGNKAVWGLQELELWRQKGRRQSPLLETPMCVCKVLSRGVQGDADTGAPKGHWPGHRDWVNHLSFIVCSRPPTASQDAGHRGDDAESQRGHRLNVIQF